MIFTPARTSSSATCWAASVGTAITPTTISCSCTTTARSSAERTISCSLTPLPIFSGSVSNMATTRKPWSAKMSEPAMAWPRWPAPNRAMLCWPLVRRILRICETSESTL